MSYSMERWVGRVALVTGASVGIGAAICKALVKEGLTVVGCARNVEKIQEIADEIEAKPPGNLHAIRCDLVEESQILEMFSEIRSTYGRLDICINNAGVCTDSPLLTGQSNDWKNMLEVNVLALCTCTREAIKLMRESKLEEGQIIHISSIAGHKLPDSSMPGFNFYCCTKFMVRALTEALRQEMISGAVNTEDNIIRVACVSPGLTETEFLYRCLSPEIASSIYARTPCLSAEDVVEAVMYILKSPNTVNVNDVLVVPTDKKSSKVKKT